MVKKFLIIAILGVITFNLNIFCRGLHIDKHGGGHNSSTDTCPIKGACPHHQHTSNHNHSHNGDHNKTKEEVSIICTCSADGQVSTIAYEIIIPSETCIVVTQPFIYSLFEDKQIYSSINTVPSEGPPKLSA